VGPLKTVGSGFLVARVAPSGPCGISGVRWGGADRLERLLLVSLLLGLVAAAFAGLAFAWVVRPLIARVERVAGLAARVGTSLSTEPVDRIDDEVSLIDAALRSADAQLIADRRALEAKTQALERFLVELGHDLKTPLASLKLSVDELVTPTSGEAGRAAIAELLYMEQLVENLRLEARLQQGSLTPGRQRFDLREVVERIVAGLLPLARRAGVALEAGLPEVAVWLEADRALVERALSNVVHNAVSHGARNVGVTLQPIQALGLFYDFRELTPIGADGDEMVRRLARRLIDVDLLDQAAELLTHQVEERLEGVARASVATDLAAVYLMDRQPEAALQALWSTRTTLLPSALNAERRALEARALLDLGRYDHALEVLGDDRGPEADAVRAEVLWKQENWAGAAAIYERLLGDRHLDAATALSPVEESRLIRAGVGYSLGEDAAGLSRLAGRYAPFVAGARKPDAIRIALYDPAALTSGAGLAAAIQSSDTFTGWVEATRARFRRETGGPAPADPPARPSPAA
jgi:hypothetical protein